MSESTRLPIWIEVLFLIIFFLGAIAVPILGPLRATSHRALVAAALVAVGAGLTLLILSLQGREES